MAVRGKAGFFLVLFSWVACATGYTFAQAENVKPAIETVSVQNPGAEATESSTESLVENSPGEGRRSLGRELRFEAKDHRRNCRLRP